MPKHEALKKQRNRTEQQMALLREVRHYLSLTRMGVRATNQIKALVRQGIISKEEADLELRDYLAPIRKGKRIVMASAVSKLDDYPVWGEWMKLIPGVGDKLGALIIALIAPVTDFPTPSHLRSYSGFNIKDGKAVTFAKGAQPNWCEDLKTTMFMFADCAVKLQRKSKYGQLYLTFKANDKHKHPEPVAVVDAKTGKPTKGRDGRSIKDYTDMHLHRRAMRKVACLFLCHLWQVWREKEGLPVCEAYCEKYLDHDQSHIISPWSMVDVGSDEYVAHDGYPLHDDRAKVVA